MEDKLKRQTNRHPAYHLPAATGRIGPNISRYTWQSPITSFQPLLFSVAACEQDRWIYWKKVQSSAAHSWHEWLFLKGLNNAQRSVHCQSAMQYRWDRFDIVASSPLRMPCDSVPRAWYLRQPQYLQNAVSWTREPHRQISILAAFLSAQCYRPSATRTCTLFENAKIGCGM